jgi:hypothetical protein
VPVPGPLTATTTTLAPALVAAAITDGDQQRTEDVRRTRGDVGMAGDSGGTLRLEELQQLLSKASQKGDREDDRFNPAVLMGGVAGARSHSGPCREAAVEIGSNVPWIGFPVAYAVSGVLLTVFGYFAMVLAN